MQHAEEAAAEAEAERHRAFRLKGQRRVVELQLLQRVAQVGIFRAVLGVDTAEHHRPCGAVAGQGFNRRPVSLGDCVAHAGVGHGFDRRGEVANLARLQLLLRRQAERQQMATLEHLKDRAGRHHLDAHAGADRPIHQAHIDDNALVGVILAVEDQRAQRRIRVTCRRRDVGHDPLEHLVDVDVHFGRDLRTILGRDADDVLDLLFHARRVRRRQVDFVDDRHNLQPCVDCKVGVAQRLRLNALRCVDDQKRAFARRKRPRHFIVEVDMAGRVDQVHLIGLPVVGLVFHAHRARLDGDATLTLQIHVVQQLLLHLALGDGLALLQQPVGQRGLAMVNMGNDGKIADMLTIIHTGSSFSVYRFRYGNIITRPYQSHKRFCVLHDAPRHFCSFCIEFTYPCCAFCNGML